MEEDNQFLKIRPSNGGIEVIAIQFIAPEEGPLGPQIGAYLYVPSEDLDDLVAGDGITFDDFIEGMQDGLDTLAEA